MERKRSTHRRSSPPPACRPLSASRRRLLRARRLVCSVIDSPLAHRCPPPPSMCLLPHALRRPEGASRGLVRGHQGGPLSWPLGCSLRSQPSKCMRGGSNARRCGGGFGCASASLGAPLASSLARCLGPSGAAPRPSSRSAISPAHAPRPPKCRASRGWRSGFSLGPPSVRASLPAAFLSVGLACLRPPFGCFPRRAPLRGAARLPLWPPPSGLRSPSAPLPLLLRGPGRALAAFGGLSFVRARATLARLSRFCLRCRRVFPCPLPVPPPKRAGESVGPAASAAAGSCPAAFLPCQPPQCSPRTGSRAAVGTAGSVLPKSQCSPNASRRPIEANELPPACLAALSLYSRYQGSPSALRGLDTRA